MHASFYRHDHRQHDFMAPALEGCSVVDFLPTEENPQAKKNSSADCVSPAFRIYTPGSDMACLLAPSVP